MPYKKEDSLFEHSKPSEIPSKLVEALVRRIDTKEKNPGKKLNPDQLALLEKVISESLSMDEIAALKKSAKAYLSESSLKELAEKYNLNIDHVTLFLKSVSVRLKEKYLVKVPIKTLPQQTAPTQELKEIKEQVSQTVHFKLDAPLFKDLEAKDQLNSFIEGRKSVDKKLRAAVYRVADLFLRLPLSKDDGHYKLTNNHKLLLENLIRIQLSEKEFLFLKCAFEFLLKQNSQYPGLSDQLPTLLNEYRSSDTQQPPLSKVFNFKDVRFKQFEALSNAFIEN